MGTKKIGGFIFRTFVSNHRPCHVHIYYEQKELGRFDIENQKPMDKKLKITSKLKRALKEAGYSK
jgi:hypothetical protein